MKVLGSFILRFALLFGFFAWPWPELKEISGGYFRAQTRLLVAVVFPHQTARIESLSDPRFPNLDTAVVVPTLHAAPNDQSAALQINFDSSSQVWVPTAMLAALCLATPLPWSKRLMAVLANAVLVQVFAAATVWVSVSDCLSSQRSPGDESLLLTFADHLLNDNIWVTFVLPLLTWAIWLAVGGHWVELGKALQDRPLPTCIPKPQFDTSTKPSNNWSQLCATASKSARAKADPKFAIETGSKQ